MVEDGAAAEPATLIALQPEATPGQIHHHQGTATAQRTTDARDRYLGRLIRTFLLAKVKAGRVKGVNGLALLLGVTLVRPRVAGTLFAGSGETRTEAIQVSVIAVVLWAAGTPRDPQIRSAVSVVVESRHHTREEDLRLPNVDASPALHHGRDIATPHARPLGIIPVADTAMEAKTDLPHAVNDPFHRQTDALTL